MNKFIFTIILFLIFVGCNEPIKKINAVTTDKAPAANFPYKCNTYTGSTSVDDIQYVNDVVFSVEDSNTINYRLSLLENWKSINKIKGKAFFMPMLKTDSITLTNGELQPAVIFRDSVKGVEFYFSYSNNKPLENCITKVKGWKKPIAKMYAK